MDMDGLWPTLGVEEEYLLINPQTRAAKAAPPKAFFQAAKKALGDHVTHEFLRCQIEIATPVCQNIDDVRTHLSHMRKTLSEIAIDHDMRLCAASTHPFSPWRTQKPTKQERYQKMDEDLQGAIRRMLICGTHIHVGILDDSMRIDIMNQMRYFLPHLLALSTSSPFWEGDKMGMLSYRLSVFDGMPRTGIPEAMASHDEYKRIVNVLVDAGVIEDATKIWWDLRPSVRFPTLEARIADMCTRMEDTLCITALYQCITHMLIKLKGRNIKWRNYPAMLIAENRWLAQRHGVRAGLIDFGKGECVPFECLIEEMLSMLMPHAQILGCEKEIAHARTIVKRGSSVCRQISIYDSAIAKGIKKKEALKLVVDDLVQGTIEGII